jgi:putative ABC transport system permease protein
MWLYIKFYFRYLLKYRTISAINLVGLSIAMLASISILLYITFENSFDKFNTNYNQIYRLHLTESLNGNADFNGYNVNPPLGPLMARTFPEIKQYTRVFPLNEAVLTINQNSFEERKAFFVDSGYFKVFDFKFISGNPLEVLKLPNTAVITKSIAKKYFGNINPIGQIIQHGKNANYRIEGIVEDVPENSHLQIDIMLSYVSDENWIHHYRDNSWDFYFVFTYLLLEKNTDITKFEKKIDLLANEHKPERIKNHIWKYTVQPMKEIHLNSTGDRLSVTGNGQMVHILALIAVLILLIAYINQTNIAIAQTLERIKATAISRVLGSTRLSIFAQFVLESVITTTICFIIAVDLCPILAPLLSKLLQFKFSLGIISFNNWIVVYCCLVAISVVAGIYPAFVILSYNTYESLKSKTKHGGISIIFRKGLVVLQYSIACALIVGALVIYLQKEFMLHKDIGMNISNSIIIKGSELNYSDSVRSNKIQLFKEELKKFAEIKGVTSSNALPGNYNYNDGIWSDVQQTYDMVVHVIYQVDYDFISEYKIKLIAGRNFSKDYPSDIKAGVIINEKALPVLGFKNGQEALGHKVVRDWDRKETKIIGIVKNFHIGSFVRDVGPMAIYLSTSERSYYSIKVSGQNIANSIAIIKQKWETAFPGEMFRYFELENSYKGLYQKEEKYGLILGVFSVLAILLACFGLFGLSYYTILQRTKEIGIRKINGASIAKIIWLLLFEFALLIVIAFIITCPISFIIMHKWIQGFVYRITLSWWIFVVAGLITITIALITVSWQAWRAASSNPIDTLRDE